MSNVIHRMKNWQVRPREMFFFNNEQTQENVVFWVLGHSRALTQRTAGQRIHWMTFGPFSCPITGQLAIFYQTLREPFWEEWVFLIGTMKFMHCSTSQSPMVTYASHVLNGTFLVQDHHLIVTIF